MSKKIASKYTRKMYKFLKGNHEIKFSKMKILRGYIEYQDPNTSTKTDTKIVLDPSDKLISTFIHEFLHYEHQDYTEEQILELEKRVMNSLSNIQVKNLIKRLAEKL